MKSSTCRSMNSRTAVIIATVIGSVIVAEQNHVGLPGATGRIQAVGHPRSVNNRRRSTIPAFTRLNPDLEEMERVARGRQDVAEDFHVAVRMRPEESGRPIMANLR
jgi:hypothetical protein